MAIIANRTGGAIMVSMLGKNLTTKEVDVYQILIQTGDPVTFSSDPLSSGNFDMITVKGKDGRIIGQVQGDEQDPSGEISFSFYEDYTFLNNDYVYGNNKNRLLNLFNGEAFVNGEDKIVPIGTNGTDKTLTARAKANEMNKPYKFLYYNEGEFIREVGTADVNNDGAVALKKNPYANSFNMSHKTLCMEFMTTTGEGQVNRMFPIIAKTTAEWAEGDINQFNLTAQRGCDLIDRDDFYTEIWHDSKTIETKQRIWEIFVNYIVTDAGTEPSDAQDNELLAKLGADGTVTIKKYSTSSWAEESSINGKIDVGTRIKSTKLITSIEPEAVNTFVAIMTGKKAVDFSTDGKKRYYCNVYDFNKDKAIYEKYVTIQ